MTEVIHAILGTKPAVATVAVSNIERARQFYQDVLGLAPVSAKESGVLSLASADTTLLVYESQFAGSNQATAVTWILDGRGEERIEDVVHALRDKGVHFEHYDFPGGTREGDVHIFGKIRNAWFKDPDGNILSIVCETQ
ncbi:VOC family protein [Uliginosibacterium sp. H3]|uniref:VOC family protein n=1 Tax=Uliginosibacterium silvisoli TaxID=3114758 RepID=A0ABU6K632_9RHOO|nr:VOC family protein [Uliginosibacterium sp. H3]